MTFSLVKSIYVMVFAMSKINFSELKRTKTESVRELYSEVERNIRGSISNAYGVPVDYLPEQLFYHYNLTPFQSESVRKLSTELNAIIACQSELTEIDSHEPDKLDYKVDMNPDEDIVLYRNSSKGLTNLIIHDDEIITYSFVSVLSDKKDSIEHFGLNESIDFETVAYKFLK